MFISTVQQESAIASVVRIQLPLPGTVPTIHAIAFVQGTLTSLTRHQPLPLTFFSTSPGFMRPSRPFCQELPSLLPSLGKRMLVSEPPIQMSPLFYHFS